MLQLKNIVKSYTVGELTQIALKGVSLSFRKNEFVSILGQSGSGKTTLLNIIGGLDRYNSGDLVINGVSTKKYKDADWDAYRNTSIGFVFQSYNLIPHQNVLSNVEMALTLSGILRKERKKRAIEVLKKVGLEEHMHKRPNQLSGGQMQRVAIARALINNPDILLADEPTGALDTETSIQIMNLLKEIAADKLVIMVTHNPELAEQYSTRIVKLKDGSIISDSDPYVPADAVMNQKHTPGKVSMSFMTSLGLSFANLKTKLGRTLLTSFAGSIGIIGIALILALSTGMNAYITNVQKETMTSYPITISAETVDASSLLQLRGQMIGIADEEVSSDDQKIHTDYSSLKQSDAITNNLIQNNLTEFKKYLDDPSSEIQQYIGENGIVYSYDVSFDVYAKNPSDQYIDTSMDIDNDGGIRNSNMRRFSFGNMSSANNSAENFSQLIAGKDGQLISSVVTDSYDVVYGTWPDTYDEVVIVLDKDYSLPVQAMYQLGFISKDQYQNVKKQLANKEEGEDFTLDYPAMLNKSFYIIPSSERYIKNEDGTYSYIENPEYNRDNILDNAVQLKVTGIIKPKDNANNANISTAVAYTDLLTNHIIDEANHSSVVQDQKSTPDINILSGVRFEAANDEEKIADTKTYLSGLSDEEKINMYQLIMYYDGQSQKEEAENQTNEFDPAGMMGFSMNGSAMGQMLDRYLNDSPNTDTLLTIYEDYIGGKTLTDNLTTFGAVSYETPVDISIYTDSFENKDAIAGAIENYNKTVAEDSQISYTDYVALMTSSLTTIINGISYVLIAFVAVSLIVSSIMIGIITYISVMERTKEIGILRALGASKRNISQLFNAETFIIGIFSGILGIVISLLLLIPINRIIQSVSNIQDLSAVLPLQSAGILILISVIITVIGGLIPSGSAAKKDPVEALRTE